MARSLLGNILSMNFANLVKATFLSISNNLNVLARTLIFLFIAFIIMDTFYLYAFTNLTVWIVYFFNLIVWTLLALNTHRVILLGASSVPRWGISKWTIRETSFFIATALMGMSFLPLISMQTFGLFVIVPFLFILWLFLRFALIFPDIAIHSRIDFNRSWELTRNHTLLMFYAIILLPIIMSIPLYLVRSLGGGIYIQSILSNFFVVIEITALSTCYAYINFIEDKNQDDISIK